MYNEHMLHILGIIAGILALIAPIPYIYETIRGETKPNRATWLIWSVLLAIALAVQIREGGTYSAILTAADLIGTSTTFILSIWHGQGGWEFLDKLSLVGAAVGLLLWWGFNSPGLALAMTILIDFSGAIPTIPKAYAHPETETASTFWLVFIGGALSTIAVGRFSLVLMAYPIYLAFVNGLLGGLVTFSPNRKLRTKHA